MLDKLNELFPKCGYVQIRPYNPELWLNKGYDSRLENKSPMTKWKSTPLTFEEAKKYAEKGYRIGWIVPEGYVVVDVDNEDHVESSNVLERILNDLKIPYSYNRTSRGVHFLFRDDMLSLATGAVRKCALGITLDYRANGSGYIILPENDPHRSWGHWTDQIANLPSFLKPIMPSKGQTSFIGMGEGEGRNTELFKWRTKLLQANILSDDEITSALRLINDKMFSVPMSEQEMISTVLKKRATDEEQRSQAQKAKPNVLEKENIYNVVANKIMRDFDLICVGQKQFYIFDKTYYRAINEMELERMIHYEVSENISGEGRKEIMRFLAVKSYVDSNELDSCWHKIAVGNGILDVITGELGEPDKNEKNTIAIPWNYNPDPPHSPAIDEFMAHISGNPDGSVNLVKQEFLYQIAGYCLLKKNYFGKFFIFRGEGQTGKSTFQDLIVKMVHANNRARVGIDKMDHDYYLATLLSKLINIDDDAVDGKLLANTGRFKSLVTGNEITVRQIFQVPITFTPFATCMFSCNKLPRIMDKTTGLYRRLVIIELNNKILKPDPLFLAKLTPRDMEYFLHKAVYWIGVALQEGKFRISQSEKELLRKFKCRQSSVNEWIYEEHITLSEVYNKGVMALYEFYIDWANRNGYQRLPSILTFKEDMCALYDVEVVYTGQTRKASEQVFSRKLAPNKYELEEVPF